MSQNNRFVKYYFVKKKKKAQYTQNITYDSSVTVTIIQSFFRTGDKCLNDKYLILE